MIQQDTVKLLRECDAGVKMGVASIDDVMPHVQSSRLRDRLDKCRQEHKELEHHIRAQLDDYGDEGKSPNPIAKGMSHLMTDMKLGLDESDATIASLMTDGCNMGVKSLNRYLNQYKAASEHSKDIAKRLINQEERLTIDLREFL